MSSRVLTLVTNWFNWFIHSYSKMVIHFRWLRNPVGNYWGSFFHHIHHLPTGNPVGHDVPSHSFRYHHFPWCLDWDSHGDHPPTAKWPPRGVDPYGARGTFRPVDVSHWGGEAIRIIPRRKWSFRAAETIAQWRFLLGNSSRNEIYSWENDLQMEVFDAGTIISVYG